MEPTLDLNPIATLLAVIIGAGLSHVITRLQSKRERRLRRADMLLEAYCDWFMAVEAALQRTARGEGTPLDEGHQFLLLTTRIDLLEQDEHARGLQDAVLDSIPVEGTEGHDKLKATKHSWQWQPFMDAVEALKVYLRKRDA